MDADSWRQAKGVLAEALLCPPAEREALIMARCADPALRREVQAYLNEYDEHFLESVLTVSETLDTTNSAADDAGQLPDVHNGDRIGPYVVLDRLGAGGMGHVFLGNDTRLHRKVALKCLIASASATELRSRILHEARAAARITHPNIAIVHDVVEHENRPFLVMEYVEGESLATLIKRERPSIEKMVAFMRQLASALAAAHAKGILLRVLKPANIQVTPQGSVKILDFGVAHAMSAATMGSTTSSAAGLTVAIGMTGDRRVMHPGTPAYMSPEQMFGRPIDQRSDIYSLGVIVYEMATGHRPYSTDDPLEVVLTLSRNFLRPGDASTSLPVQINDVVAKMLAVKPDDRYQTAGELENALVTLTAQPDVPVPTVRSRARVATRIAAVVLALPLAVGAVGFLTSAWFNHALGRVAPFSDESPTVWLVMGLRSLLTPVVRLAGVLLAIWAIRFVVRILSLSRRMDSLLTNTRSQSQQLSERLKFDDPAVIAQAVAGVGLIALGFVAYLFADVLTATATYYSTAPDITAQSALLFLHRSRVANFRLVLDVFIFIFAAASLRILRLRTGAAIRRGAGALAVVSLLLVLTVSLSELPYRLAWWSTLPRVAAGDSRCYIIGESSAEMLLFCPDDRPPRTKKAGKADPSVRRTGVDESVFSPPDISR